MQAESILISKNVLNNYVKKHFFILLHHGAPEYNSFGHLTDIVTPKTNTDSVELCIKNQDDETVEFRYTRIHDSLLVGPSIHESDNLCTN